jgi:hypothetical protein
MDFINGVYRLTLRPGEQESLTVAYAAEWGLNKANFFFPQPGNYSIRWTCHPWPLDSNKVFWPDPVLVVVARPVGVDEAVYQLLRDNPKLVGVMMSPATHSGPDRAYGVAVPDAETVRQLETIVLRYPKSSYADYARFALARAYLQGDDQAARAPEADKVAATALLEAINFQEFAYSPSALLLLRAITSDQRQADQLKVKLEAEYYDAIEWIVEEAKWVESLAPQLRRQMRKEGPTKRGPRRPRQ